MAAPSFIAASGPTGNSNNYSVARPSGVTTGDLIIAFVRAPSSHTGNVAATGWTELTGLRSLGVDWTDDYVFYRFVQSGDASSDTWGDASDSQPSAVWQVAYSGVDSIVAASSILRGTTSDTSIVAPAVTAPDPDCLLVGLFGHYDAETTISVSGMTQRIIGLGSPTGNRAAIFDEVLSSAGSTGTRTATLGASRGGRYGALIALVPAATGETITLAPDPASVQVGGTRTFTATRSAPAGAGGVTYNVSSDNPAVATVPTPQALTEADSDLTFDATGVSVGTANITITNAADSSETDTVALTVTAVTTKRAKFLVHPDFASATGITIEVNEAPTGGALTGAKLGFATGIAAESTLEAGQAVIKVNAADVGASALAAGTSVRAIFKGTTSASSPLGNAVEGGSVATAAGTIIEE